MNPLVSVITPSFNQARYIEETIRSVKEQTYPNIEHIVIDGGSTDGTIDILRRYHHIYWISEPDKGQSDAINKGIRLAKGEIIGWLNSDDLYLPETVTIAVETLIANPEAGMVYSDYEQVYMGDSGILVRTVHTIDFELGVLFSQNFIPQPTVFLRREALDKVGLLDTSLHHAMDYDLWMRVGMNFEVIHIPRVLARFRMHPDSKTTKERDIQLKEGAFVIERYLQKLKEEKKTILKLECKCPKKTCVYLTIRSQPMRINCPILRYKISKSYPHLEDQRLR